MNHSFNVEIAEKYGMEKAVLLENFYFWIKKNKANKKNLHEGRCYTYNTAEAFAELFPYIKERRIAQLLREMENEDNLLLSGQFFNYDRTKSYTLTDFALSFFEPSNIQNFDNGTYKNMTKEDTETGDCLNTDIKPNVKTTDTHTDCACVPDYLKQKEIKKEEGGIVAEIFDMLQAFNSTNPKHKIPISKDLFQFQCKEGRAILPELKNYSREELSKALYNYLTVADSDTWKSGFSFGAFCKNISEYTPEFFDMTKYIDLPKDEDIEKLTEDFADIHLYDKWFDYAVFCHHRKEWILAGKPMNEAFKKWADDLYLQDKEKGLLNEKGGYLC